MKELKKMTVEQLETELEKDLEASYRDWDVINELIRRAKEWEDFKKKKINHLGLTL